MSELSKRRLAVLVDSGVLGSKNGVVLELIEDDLYLSFLNKRYSDVMEMADQMHERVKMTWVKALKKWRVHQIRSPQRIIEEVNWIRDFNKRNNGWTSEEDANAHLKQLEIQEAEFLKNRILPKDDFIVSYSALEEALKSIVEMAAERPARVISLACAFATSVEFVDDIITLSKSSYISVGGITQLTRKYWNLVEES